MKRLVQATLIGAIVLLASLPIQNFVAPEWRKWALATVAGLATFVIQRATREKDSNQTPGEFRIR
ncbi:hypothetical protein MNR01_00270 [Lysobacter sp. S4-A87]|uniref:hypothetical protein n=1 Tax=Lysobacter sp. S4-A87 TaxID=2925843 RepID=UPI001F52BDAE|nr:hypothetical protein [Lysobacter sp. S4-A87]UNK49519.1 hypothetical protein MNR01_00270 [Lysobacter sp. S4-A87]